MDPNVTTTTPAGSTQLGALTSPTCVRFHSCNAERFEAECTCQILHRQFA